MSSTTLVGLFDGYMSAARNGLTSETKLGGCATYFPPLNEEEVEQIDRWTRCGVCGHRMFLVLQAFSPLPTAVGPHQRMMYVFGCNSASCSRQPSSSYCAFSRQVDEEDVAALHDDDDIDEEEEEEEEEQQPLTAEEMGPNALPPSFIFVDDEPLKTTITLTEAERAVLQKMEDGSANNTTTQAELEEMEKKIDLRNKKADYYYEVFRARMARAPTQVLRYHQRCRGDDGSATTSGKRARPLFMHPGKVRREHRVPSCSTCGAALVHEVQVMPTALYYLHVQHFNNKNNNNSPSASGPANLADVEGGGGMDFGTLTLYSCGHSCAATYPGRLLQREYLLVESPPAENDDDDDDDGKKSGAKLTFHDFVDGASPASPTGDPQLVDSEQEEDDDDDDDDDGDSSGSDVE